MFNRPSDLGEDESMTKALITSHHPIPASNTTVSPCGWKKNIWKINRRMKRDQRGSNQPHIQPKGKEIKNSFFNLSFGKFHSLFDKVYVGITQVSSKFPGIPTPQEKLAGNISQCQKIFLSKTNSKGA
ncbi:hypothetical protein O181_099520 [Austropuccinia psidii MF-1]|uniref:Uncharacterized protein n=1 Tax=Austropuccinia psidii MF-1 TaxID=1389203 RepID=A0A9Q3PFY5_9BASI|nr:hypothetical protein [Austropuccinia psidii MF-1]